MELGDGGYLCSEGDTIVFMTSTPELPDLMLCGELLRPSSLRRSDQGFIAEYEHLIDTWAGRTIFVLSGGIVPEQIQLDIGPHENKLAPNEWEALIRELSIISEALPWGMSPGGAPGRMTADALVCVHPAIIEQQLPLFSKLLKQLLANPPERTIRVRAIQPLDGSRKIDLRTSRWLSKRPLELAGVQGLATDEQTPNSRALADQPLATKTIDHPFTRYVAHLLGRVLVRLRASVNSLGLAAGHGVRDPSAAAYAKQLAENLGSAAREIERIQQLPLFRNVRPEPLTDSVLQSLPDHPLQSLIHRVGRRLISPGLAFAPGQDLYSALKHSFDLFELMVLYRLIGEITRSLPDWHLAKQGTVRRLPHEDRPPDFSTWIWKGPGHQELALYYQATFSSAAPPPDLRLFSSLSNRGVPDYVLVHSKSRDVVSWVILDAKYRSSKKSIHDALADVHRYRDSLRMSGRRAEGAFIIVPRLREDASLYGEVAYLTAHNFGAIEIGRDDWLQPLWASLKIGSLAD